jgi:hypothetical protein
MARTWCARRLELRQELWRKPAGNTRARRIGQRKDPRRDRVENGILIGALSGALTGVGHRRGVV